VTDRNTTPYLTIGEAAQRLGVRVETIRTWDRKGKIQSVRTIGGHRRILRTDVERLEGKRS
jgi:putative resolvase